MNELIWRVFNLGELKKYVDVQVPAIVSESVAGVWTGHQDIYSFIIYFY